MTNKTESNYGFHRLQSPDQASKMKRKLVIILKYNRHYHVIVFSGKTSYEGGRLGSIVQHFVPQ